MSDKGGVSSDGRTKVAIEVLAGCLLVEAVSTAIWQLGRTLGQLTTPVSTLRFNHDAQILAMASKDKKDSMRLVHLPSLTAFGNWPTSSTPLGHVTTVDFSARSEYVAIGNTRGRVLLYHLKDYGAGGANGFSSF
ncbi:hypothetical protein CVT26_002851 [Gymnopilus dilepis]|uniref:Anaphase-promoting complex subunit 4 WD40 domain-containing protein n=1 Tax=Gymnopilus dilepis TaxID=231916 RepID=A0A409Y3B4_9AGAR|nr:hypothetical protein CVT26_002851 [Gymnopilus dilepis]